VTEGEQNLARIDIVALYFWKDSIGEPGTEWTLEVGVLDHHDFGLGTAAEFGSCYGRCYARYV
jgi:hypothetical protein